MHFAEMQLNLLSLSLMIITVLFGTPVVMLLSNELLSIISSKVSLSSNILSLTIVMLNDTLITPAGNVTLYGPES